MNKQFTQCAGSLGVQPEVTMGFLMGFLSIYGFIFAPHKRMREVLSLWSGLGYNHAKGANNQRIWRIA